MRARMRTIGTVAALGMGMTVMAAGPSAAGKPIQSYDQYTAIDCVGTVADRELIVTGYFDGGGQSTGGDAEFHDGQTLIWGDVARTSTLTGDDFELDATFEYGQSDDGEGAAQAGEPGSSAGTMTVSGSASASGDPQVIDERWRDANIWTSASGTVQSLQGLATVTAATGDVAEALGAQLACSGHVVDVTYRATNPTSLVAHDLFFYADCPLPTEPPTSVLNVTGSGTSAWGFLGLGMTESDEGEGVADLIATGDLDNRGGQITGNLVVEVPAAQVGQTVAVDLRVGGRVGRDTYRDRDTNFAIKEVATHRALTGQVTLPDGRTIAVDCVLTQVRATYHVNTRAGQKPGGRPPTNDLAAGALAIAAGQQIAQSTRGAAEPPEAPCTLTDGEEQFDVPVGRTVWYRFVGTGGEVTLSTAGSDFDTVLGVYTDAGGPGEQVACVDDVPLGEEDYSLQAAVTVSTAASASYLVQVGGFGSPGEGPGPQWGDLVVSRN